jgi:hypothetical protein
MMLVVHSEARQTQSTRSAGAEERRGGSAFLRAGAPRWRRGGNATSARIEAGQPSAPQGAVGAAGAGGMRGAEAPPQIVPTREKLSSKPASPARPKARWALPARNARSARIEAGQPSAPQGAVGAAGAWGMRGAEAPPQIGFIRVSRGSQSGDADDRL